MRKKYVLFIAVILCFFTESKAVSYYYYVQFKDKNNSPYSLSNPLAYLSQRALDRRAFFNIPIDKTDLPVNPDYVAQVANFVIVHARTKWLNGVTVQTTDPNQINLVRNLECVSFVELTAQTNTSGSLISRQKLPQQTTDTNYGSATTQINQLKGAVLHNNSYRGQGIHIAVIDAGFNSANTNPGFDSLRTEGRLLGTKNFVAPQVDVFTQNIHGANVLSTMAGNIKDVYVGTAPKASYLLLLSEANNTETRCEPDLWISAIEYADSAGVDVSTTSLGYTTFDDPSMNFTYANMNGKTARASIAAAMAVEKGILVINSAGNDGNKTFHHIGVPADADKIITIGSVTSDGIISAFSSFGPSADGRVKPELCAMGTASALINTTGTATYGNGTSYATPIFAGLAACFLQAAKEKTPHLSLTELKELLVKSGSLYPSHTDQMGYGIANFESAYNQLLEISRKHIISEDGVQVYVSRKENILKVIIQDTIQQEVQASLFNVAGNLIMNQNSTQPSFGMDIHSLSSGVYIFHLNFNGKTVNRKLMIQ